jgi:hypothetical protein
MWLKLSADQGNGISKTFVKDMNAHELLDSNQLAEAGRLMEDFKTRHANEKSGASAE